MSNVETYNVEGMTCDHCVAAVSGEIRALPGVVAVEVDLPTGVVTVTSDAPLPAALIASAVDEAGYRVVTPA